MRPLAILLVVAIAAFVYSFVMMRQAMRALTVRLRNNARNPHGKNRSFERFGMPGVVVANDLLDEYGLSGYSIVPCNSITTNRCDFNDERIILSNHVYDGSTNVSVSIAAHEAAHAKVDSDSPWTASLATRLKLLRHFLYAEIAAFLVTGVAAYGLGAVEIPFPYMPMVGAIALLVTNILLAVITLVDEYRTSFTAIAFIERQYGACGRKAARCATILKEALVTYAWTGIVYILGSVALVLLFAII